MTSDTDDIEPLAVAAGLQSTSFPSDPGSGLEGRLQ